MWRHSSALHRLLIFLFTILAARPVEAHEPDTSYLRLRVRPDLLEIRVTLDTFTLQKIAPTLDANKDDALSQAELRTSTPAIRTFIEQSLGLEVDGKAVALGKAGDPFWPLDAPDPLPKARWHDQTALISFPYDLTLAQPAASVAVVFDGFEQIGLAHRILGVLEEPGHSEPVILSNTRRDHRFALRSAPASASAGEVESAHPSPSTAGQFFWEGVKHIVEGYDHLCFLLALLLVAKRVRDVVWIVSAFTVAHSITLILAAQKIVVLPGRLVECAIAATIVWVAVENYIRKEVQFRWLWTFVFGLIHGFGFANVLGELQLPDDSLVTCLLLFNVGVEAGQLAIVAVLWPILMLLSRSLAGRRTKLALNGAVLLLGLAWLSDRVFQLDAMPF